ncbi:MAG: S-methyl-5-thioribose kinase [Tissierellaceae bacterium]|nr:S-methyl-5-thioribose kinase [Tissierellaceae bacterium]
MANFSSHFKMEEKDIIIYAKENLNIFDKDAFLKAKEIGDGNINYVFKVWDEISGKSVVIKHADVALRNTPGRLLDTDRNRIEAEILVLHSKLAPGHVPEVYNYDPIMCALSMEDISDHGNLRHELLSRKKFPRFADDISTFMVNTLLLTTDLVMDSGEKKNKVRNYINIDLCDISEKLVFSEPYTDYLGRNVILDENKVFVEKIIYDDKKLVLEAGKLKNAFMNNAQSLVHGDLHSGSIFVKEDSTMVIDPEFAFYGPMGYDLGNVIGNLFFSWANAYVTMEDGEEKDNFLAYIEKTIVDIIDLFKEKFIKLYEEAVTDIMAKQEGYMEWYLSNVLSDACGVAGLEILRRTVGDSKVVDITCVENIEDRIIMERILILLGKNFILNRDKFTGGWEYINSINNALQMAYGFLC